MKGDDAATAPGEDAIQHEGVHVQVEIKGSPKPLDHGHRTPATVHDATVARAGAQAPEDGADEHGDDAAAHVVVPRQLVPQAIGQAQHPLAHGRVGEHVIEQVGGALGHPTAAAIGTDRAAFAGKRD